MAMRCRTRATRVWSPTDTLLQLRHGRADRTADATRRTVRAAIGLGLEAMIEQRGMSAAHSTVTFLRISNPECP